MPHRWQMTPTQTDGDHVYLYDAIGAWNWEQDMPGVEAFRRDLSKLTGETLHIHLNSPGGSVPDGVAMMSLLAAHPAKLVTHVDGMALSMASAIAMVAPERRMAKNAMLMIHNPWTMVSGDAATLRKAAEMLDAWGGTFRDSYARASGMSSDEVSAMMDAETWLTADEAKERKLITDIDDPVPVAACAVPEAIAKKAPEWALNLLAPKPASEEEAMSMLKRVLAAFGVSGETEADAVRLAELVEAFGDVDGRDAYERGLTVDGAKAEAAMKEVEDKHAAEMADALAKVKAAETARDEATAAAASAAAESATAKAESAAWKAKVAALAPGLAFDAAAAGASESADSSEYMAAIRANVKNGMKHEEAIAKAQKELPEAFAAFIRSNTKSNPSKH